MKLWAIRLGKVLNSIRNDGFIKGIKKALSSIFMLYKNVDAGNVLIISDGTGDSNRYRCKNVCEELNKNGIKTSVISQDNKRLLQCARTFAIFIFHRTFVTKKLSAFIYEIKKQNKIIIFDTDDLVYDPQYLSQMNYYKNINTFEKILYKNGVSSEIVNDPYVKYCTTSTQYLAKKLEEKNKKVFVIKNKLSDSDVKIAREILENPIKINKFNVQKGCVIVGYFSGTISHNKDFDLVTDVLSNILQKYKHCLLFLAGPLDVNSKLNIYKDQIITSPYVEREKHFKNIAAVDINIVPLEIGKPFVESKSEIKFIEAGIFGVPTIASTTDTFQKVIIDGKNGMLAKNTQEWQEKIELMIKDEDLRKRIGYEAKKTVLKSYVTNVHDNVSYYEFLEVKIKEINDRINN